MDNLSYYDQRNINNFDKIQKILLELPPYCKRFFVGIEQSTTTLTRLNYAYDLRIFFDFLLKNDVNDKKYNNINKITLEDLNSLNVFAIENFLSYLSNYKYKDKFNQCNERAKARKLASIRSFFKYFFNNDLLKCNLAAKIATPKIHEKEIVRLEHTKKNDEMTALLNLVEFGDGLSPHQKKLHQITKMRDNAIVSLFLGTGIRISELIGLNNEDLNFKDNSFIVTRKGGNRTILFFSNEIAIILQNYLQQKTNNKKIPLNENSLFLSSTTYTRISVRAVEVLVKKYAKIISPLKKITPHKLRSTFGTELYRSTGDIYFVADFLGHKDINTTKKHYAAINEDQRKNVAKIIKLRENNHD